MRKCILKILLEQQFVAELVTELTPAVKKELKTAHRHMSALVCSFLERSTLHSHKVVIWYLTVRRVTTLIPFFNSTASSFQYSPPSGKEDAQNCDTEPPELLLVDSGTSIY